MADLMKVLKGLMACGKAEFLVPADCNKCPYKDEPCQNLIADAIELINQQQIEIIECQSKIEELLNEERLKTVPTVFGRELVLCEDCKHGELHEYTGYYFCKKASGEEVTHKPDWYCADGERRDADGHVQV